MATDSFLAMQSATRSRLTAFGKAGFYLLLALIGALLVSAVAKALLGASLIDLAQGGATTGATRAILLLIGLVILPTALVLKLFREPFELTGWLSGSPKRLMGWGLATGFVLVAAMAEAMWLSGCVTFRIATPTMATAVSSLTISTALWLAQAAVEEGLHRGYAFVQVCRAISFWPAAILSSLLFLYGHVGNPGETALGIVSAGLLGLVLSYSLLKTGSLWFALGFHASWNFSQSFVFGFYNSGGKPPASFLSATLEGSPLMTGGNTGPEASLLVFPALVVLIVIIRRLATSTRGRHDHPAPSVSTYR